MSATATDSLWSYALERYARPGAEALCLRLQDDHGWDVCELLWVAWLAGRGSQPDLSDAEALAAVRRWQREMTLPLRQRRRELKREAHESPHLEPLRQALKQAELLAERETLRRLERLPAHPAPKDERSAREIALNGCRSLNPIEPEAYPLLHQLFTHWLMPCADAEPTPTC